MYFSGRAFVSAHNTLGSIPGTHKIKSKGYLSKSVVRESTVQTPDSAVVTWTLDHLVRQNVSSLYA